MTDRASLAASLGRLDAQFSGTLGVWACHLETGEIVEWNARRVFPAASTIKLAVLYETYRQCGEGRVSPEERIPLRREDVVPGSGILKDLTPGLELSVRDLATLMVVVSDNTAANILLDLVGIPAVNATLAQLGLRDTRLEHKFFRAPPGGPPNRSTPADLGALMRLVATGSAPTPWASREMLDILDRQHLTDTLMRRISDYDAYLEPGRTPTVRVASKSGALRGTRNEVAFIRTAQCRYVLAVMTTGCADTRFHADNEGALVVAEVSACLYRYFHGIP